MLKPEGCKSCEGYGWSKYEYVPPSGSGDNGVLILGEAAGESEALEGMGFVGKAGMFLFQALQRVGIDREGFRIDNVVHCRPPKNVLVGASYEIDVITKCQPYLQTTINDMKVKCKENGKTFTIITLGRTAFKAVMGFNDKNPILHKDYIGYPFWSDLYRCWVVPAYHPSYLMRGNTHLVPILQFAATRAIEIAKDGFKYDEPDYLLDPSAKAFEDWCNGYFDYVKVHPETILSYDIETPMKQGNDEEDVAKEDDDDYTILRCSFSYKPHQAVSVVWGGEHRAMLEILFGFDGIKCGWNSSAYDRPRILAQMPMNGVELDGMLMWHVLNSSLPKGLGFVAPYYAQHQSAWKWMSDKEPALYNAIDADVALQCVLGIKEGLKANKLWEVFERHIIEVHKVFNYMSNQGVLIDKELRTKAEVMLASKLEEVENGMEAAVPVEARKFKIYKKLPKVMTSDISEVVKDHEVKYCEVCGLQKPGKAHIKVCPETKVVNLLEPTIMWAKPLEFKVSKLGLSNYQKALKHQAIVNRKEGKITFDEKAIIQLIKKHPKDNLYPLILKHRGTQKLLSTYIGVTQPDGRIKGGLPLGPDGRVHCVFTSNPSTLRSACQQPNLQNQPRPKGPDDPSTVIRNLFIAKEGSVFTATDFSGIEAKLVGYFADDPGYMRLCAIDVHSFYTAHAISALDGRIKPYDLPELSWSDERLSSYLGSIKKEFKSDRNNLYKHLVHACVTGDHEVLTPEGWKRFDTLDNSEMVAQWSHENGISFVHPSRIIKIPYTGPMYRWISGDIDLMMTPWHKIPMSTGYGYFEHIVGYDSIPDKKSCHILGLKNGIIDSFSVSPKIQIEAQFNGDVYCVTVPSGMFLVRRNGKVVVSSNCNFGQKANGAQEKILLETGVAYPVATIKKVQDVYYELFPKIPKWQWNMLLRVEKDGFLRNPFGYIHRFTRPFDYEKIGGQWQKKAGVDANKIYAFLPQSTAAGIIKEAMLRMYNDKFEEVGQYLRLLIHDELFAEVPEDMVDYVTKLMQDEMSLPIQEMPVSASYGIGSHLSIGVESKIGKRWGQLK